jgi:hypothetical protein
MSPTIDTLRAVAAELLRRKLRKFLIVTAVLLLAALLVSLYLASLSGWWLILVIIVLLFSALFVAAAAGTMLVLGITAGNPDSAQKAAVHSFVDKLEVVLDRTQIPLPFLIVRITWDLLHHRKLSYVLSTINNAATLRPDFVALQSQFDNPR